MMDIGIPVELEGVYGEFYSAIVCSLDSPNELHANMIDVSRNAPVGEVVVPPSSMRLPPELSDFSFEPLQGQEVDVLIPCCPSDTNSESDNSAPSILSKLSAWWPGRIKKVGGGFVIVELVSTFSADVPPGSMSSDVINVSNGLISIPLPSSIEKTDIVERNQLRPRSQQPNLTSAGFHMHAIDIPDELVPYCREPSNYQHFARRCGLPVLVCMAPESMQPVTPREPIDNDTYELKARLLVISTESSTVNRAAVIDNTFIDMLRQKVLILQQTEELSRKLEASLVKQVDAPFVEEVYVPGDLILHAIGYQGANIKQANSIEGIISIKLHRPTSVFRICGKTEDSVKRAKAMLDYRTKIIPVPHAYVSFIVGSGHRHIQHIVDRMGLRGLKIYEMGEDAPDFVAFRLTGTSQAIRDAQMFLEFHIASLQDLDTLRGVKCQPSMPPPKEPLQSATHSDDGKQENLNGLTGSSRTRRKGLRSSQHSTSQSTVLTNGDINGCAVDTNESDHEGVKVPDEISAEPQCPRVRPNPRNRPRRTQLLQSNSNAPLKNGDVDNTDHLSEDLTPNPTSAPNRYAVDSKPPYRRYDRRRPPNGTRTNLSNGVPAIN